MMKSNCPKCEKWAHGYDVIEILFGFRRLKKRYISQSWCRDCRSIAKNEVKKIKIDLLEGMTNSQKIIVKGFVKKGLNPLGFAVDVPNDNIFYMGRQII